MADGLIAFLNARLDEDEAAARQAAQVAGPGWKAGTYWPEDESSRTRTCVRSEYGAFLADFDEAPDYPDLATHIALHDPGRALRRVEGARIILARYADTLARMEDDDYPAGVARDQAREYEDFVLPCLAAAWSDHPDYDPDWAP
jgi:hypothetical protein